MKNNKKIKLCWQVKKIANEGKIDEHIFFMPYSQVYPGLLDYGYNNHLKLLLEWQKVGKVININTVKI